MGGTRELRVRRGEGKGLSVPVRVGDSLEEAGDGLLTAVRPDERTRLGVQLRRHDKLQFASFRLAAVVHSVVLHPETGTRTQREARRPERVAHRCVDLLRRPRPMRSDK